MKKILAILLLMGLVFSLVACGSSSDSDDESDSKFVRVDAESDKFKRIDDTEDFEKSKDAKDTKYSEESEDSGETVKIESDLPYPAIYSDFNSGLWYFEAISKGGNEPICCVLDFNSEEIIKLGADIDGESYEKDAMYLYKEGYVDAEKNTIVNVKTGETLLELGPNQEFCFDFLILDGADGRDGGWSSDGIRLVLETVESMDGNTYSVGVVNYKGEWVSESMTQVGFGQEGMDVRFAGDGLFVFTKDYLCYLYDCYKGSIDLLPGVPIRRVENTFYLERYEDHILCVYDIETGAVTETTRDCYDLFYGDYIQWVESGYFRLDDGDVIKVEGPSGTISTFDMSRYSDNDYCVNAITSDKMFASVENDEGVMYACLFNADGSMAFEPISTQVGNGYKCYLTNEKLVAWASNEILVYDIESGELVHKKEWPYSVELDIREKNMLIVQGEHPEYGCGYYLVDVNNLDTLINPFEKYECK